MKKEDRKFAEEKAEGLLEELCGDFTCKEENLNEDLEHKASKSLLKEDKVFAEFELEVLEMVLPKFKKFLKAKKVALAKVKF